MGLYRIVLMIMLMHTTNGNMPEDSPTGRRLLAEKNAAKARRQMPSSEKKCIEMVTTAPLKIITLELTPVCVFKGYPPRGGWTLDGCVCVMPNHKCIDKEVDVPANGEVPDIFRPVCSSRL